MKDKFPKTFRARIIACNMLIIICIAAAISIYNYTSYKKDLIRSETANAENRLYALSARLTIACGEMINIVQNCAERRSTSLFEPYRGYNSLSKEQSAVYAANVLRDLCAISGYADFIYKITLYNSDSPLIQCGSSSGNLDDAQRIMEAPWFSYLLHRETGQNQLILVKNPFSLGTKAEPYLIPLIRPLKLYNLNTPENAWVFLAISPQLFQDALSVAPPSCKLAVTTSRGDLIAGHNQTRKEAAIPLGILIPELDNHPETISGTLHTQIQNRDCILTYTKIPVSGLILYEVLFISDMPLDFNVIKSTVGLTFVFCIAIGLFLSLLFARYHAAPIKRLALHLESVASGNFTKNPDIEAPDEIGWIGKRINDMSCHIQNLVETRIEGEKEKKDLEIKMLQAQINPHFLYNTLDSIKWIAKMQHNQGIVQVVTALSSLLKNMAKGFNEKVTLRQELDFLNDYVVIEKIRYIELFDMEIQIDDPALYDARIIKLTLQPIVENAIFSGIEPSGSQGLIRIHVFARHQTLYITVTDNGIGISQDNIKQLLTDTNRVSKSYMSGIGLPNVDRRFKLVYGDSYGLSIVSEVGHYTAVTISLPLELPL